MTVFAASKVETARMFAHQKHGAQLRNLDGAQTISHLENVVAILKDYGHSDPDLLTAAYLHDCLEETDTTLQHLVVRFGGNVAELDQDCIGTPPGVRAELGWINPGACYPILNEQGVVLRFRASGWL